MDNALTRLLGGVAKFLLPGSSRVAKNLNAGLVLRGGVDEYSKTTQQRLDEATRLAKQALNTKNNQKQKDLLERSRIASNIAMTTGQQMKNDLQTKSGMTFEQGLDQPSYLKQGLGVSTDAATLLLPAGKGLGAATAIGAGLGGARAVSEETDPLTGMLLGGAFSGAGYGIGKGVSKLADKAGRWFSLRGIRPSPSQQREFLKKTGTNLEDFVIDNNLIGKGTEEIDEVLNKLSNQYDDLAMNSGTKIPTSKVMAAFQSKIDDLAAQPNTGSQAQAAKLAQEMAAFADKFKGKKTLDIKDITLARRGIDKLLKEGAFERIPEQAGPLKMARDAYKSVIDDATKGVTGDIGKKFKAFKEFRDILSKQQFLGKGTLPANLTRLLGAGAGATAGAGYGYQDEGIGGALKGAAVGAALTQGVNHPSVINALARSGINLGKFMQSPAVAGTLEKGARVVGQKAGGLFDTITQRGIEKPIPQPTETQQKQTSEAGKTVKVDNEEFLLEGGKYYSQDKAWVFDEKADDWVENPNAPTTQPNSEGMQQLFTMLMVKDLAETGGKNLTELQIIADRFKPQADEKISATQAKNNALITSGLRGLENATKIYESDPSILIKKVGTFGLGTREYDASIFRAVESLLRSRSGAAVPETEVRRYMKNFTPTLGDTNEVAIYKLQQLRKDLEDAQNASKGVNNIDALLQMLGQQ